MGRLKHVIFFAMVLMFCSICQVTFAQPGDPTEPVPITGIEILLALGGLLGIKKIIDARRTKK